MRYLKSKIALALSLLSLSLFAQGNSSDRDTLRYNYDIDLGFGTYYQFSTFGSTNLNTAQLPGTLLRREGDRAVRDAWNLDNDRLSDNPLFHGSYFFRLGAQFRFNEHLAVTGAVNLEQRGFSDGVFSNRTRNFFPYFNAAYANTIGRFSYLFQVGDFRDFKLYEGLTFDNLETQSWIFKLKYGKFYFKHAGVGDLVRGIGLNIGDLYDYSLGVEGLLLTADSTTTLDVRIGESNNRGAGKNFFNTSGRITHRGAYSFYTQLAVATNRSTAFLVGASLRNQPGSRLNLTASLEYRAYQADFNRGFANTVYYRRPDESASFANSTHETFVPLNYYERRFSQWAVFTEYQDRDIRGLNLTSQLDYPIVDKLFLKAKADFNWLFSEAENFLYPFYQLGIGVRPVPTVEVTLELTNKVLNLDKNFPTFYVSQTPYFLLRLYKPLKFIAPSDRQHRR